MIPQSAPDPLPHRANAAELAGPRCERCYGANRSVSAQTATTPYASAWSVVVLTLGLATAATLFAGVLVISGSAEVQTAVWAAAVLVGTASSAAMCFAALAGRRRSLRGGLAAYLLEVNSGHSPQ